MRQTHKHGWGCAMYVRAHAPPSGQKKMAVAVCTLKTLWLRGVLPAASASSCSRSYGTETRGKIYELRRYKVKPDRRTEFLRLGAEKYEEVVMPLGKLLGYWGTHLGSLNEVYHIWEYDSYAHRDDVLKSKLSDKRAMQEYLIPAVSCVESMSHVIMKTVPWYTPKLELPQKWGVYELATLKVKPEMMPQLEHRLLQGLPARLADGYPHPLAMWYSEFGTINMFISLWPHESFDKRDEYRTQVLRHNEEWNETRRDCAKSVDEIDVQGLIPMSWSPLK